MDGLHIMLDLETLSSESNAAVVAIGACVFWPDPSKAAGRLSTPGTYYRVIDGDSAEAAGGHVSASTFAWWCQQSDEARRIFRPETPKMHINDALSEFRSWVDAHSYVGKVNMWGNGADFDNVVLGTAYKNSKIKKPWSFRYNRCYRTLKNLPKAEGIRLIRQGTHHNALDDALTQADHACRILAAMRGEP